MFDEKSGDTHFLDEVAQQGLLCLRDDAGTLSDIHRRLADRLDIEADDELMEYVRLLIDRFLDAGLIECTP